MKTLYVVFLLFACFPIHAQGPVDDLQFYIDSGLSYNIVDGYHYKIYGLIPLLINSGVRGDVKVGNGNRIGARVRLVFFNYRYKGTFINITEFPLEMTWTVFPDLPLYLYAGYCIPVLDGIGGVDCGFHAEYRNIFVEVAPKIFTGGAIGLNVMLGYSYHFVN